MEHTILKVEKKQCCGCGACYNICPKQAISMEYDEEGFLYPHIDENLCISCGKCQTVCPSLHGIYDRSTEPKCFAALASDEIRLQSSSGGLFSVLAEHIIEENGVVCGAAYDKNHKVHHIVVDNCNSLAMLKKSKYVQSDTEKVYTELKQHLENGRKALFTGCPCQAAGLRTFLGKEYENLYIVDLMCHGAPSPGLFEKYKNMYHGHKQVKDIGFREKDFYGWSTEMTVRYADGSEYHNTRSLDPFYKAFLPLLSTRPHCGECRYSVVPRQGDITLADFWGVDKYDKKYNDGKGTTLMAVNSQKGMELLSRVKEKLKVCDQIPDDYIYKTGQPFDHCFRSHPARDRYMRLVQKYPMEKAYEYAVKRKFDVAIMGVWSGCNYGSIMTYYALYKLVESFGLDVLMIDKPKLSANDPELRENHSRRFARENYPEISKSYTLKELRTLNAHVDTFLIGSDQVWNYGISRNFGRSYFFDFVDDDKKKIAYAASFGHDGFFASKQEKQTTKALLKRFDAISVRESRGVSICKDTFQVNAQQVLDPVFAADPVIFDEIASRSKADEKEEYIVSYLLDPTPEKREALLYAAEKMNCKLINMLDGIPWKFEENKRKLNLPNTVENLQVEDWLYYFKHSRFVITDSCHGASFAILFKRPFICIANKHRGLSRFESLLSLFHLKNRYVTDAADIVKPGKETQLFSDIDYDAVYRIMDAERRRSRIWLKDALFAPKIIHSWRAYPIVDEEMNVRHKCEIQEVRQQTEVWKNKIKSIPGAKMLWKIMKNRKK